MTEPLGSTTEISDEAIEAAARAVAEAWPTDSRNSADWHPDDVAAYDAAGRWGEGWDAVNTERQKRVALAVLAAAVPLIERQIREQIAAEIEALRPHIPAPWARNRREAIDARSTLNAAARVARGEST